MLKSNKSRILIFTYGILTLAVCLIWLKELTLDIPLADTTSAVSAIDATEVANAMSWVTDSFWLAIDIVRYIFG